MRTCDPKRGQQILDAAAQLFAKHRYHEVRMDDIAEHACVAKGTVYRYFHDKEELYLALTRHGLHQLFEESQAIIVGPGCPDTKLRGIITHIVHFYEQFPYFLELIQRIETSNSPESLNTLNEIRTRFYLAVTDLMTQLKQNDHPQLAALALLGMIRGILRFTPQPWPEHLDDWIYRQFRHGLSAEEPRTK